MKLYEFCYINLDRTNFKINFDQQLNQLQSFFIYTKLSYSLIVDSSSFLENGLLYSNF